MPISPFAVVAEVMDKEPSVALICLAAVLLAVSGFAAGRYRPKALFLIVPLSLLGSYAVLVELRDPFVEKAIRAEAGSPYVLGVYLAVFLALLAPVAGLWVRRHEREQPGRSLTE